ncbi:hypothetical protein FF38_07802 [Lucilia cuprina]|uniref:Uncharacterized protein n=1 Tax=Lucilia cuprina TaxID=7375 RepID=A0A0L0BYQ2_LUCCU|nr:hypothetical protein FF38_07802 [Lucilia cuprina]
MFESSALLLRLAASDLTCSSSGLASPSAGAASSFSAGATSGFSAGAASACSAGDASACSAAEPEELLSSSLLSFTILFTLISSFSSEDDESLDTSRICVLTGLAKDTASNTLNTAHTRRKLVLESRQRIGANFISLTPKPLFSTTILEFFKANTFLGALLFTLHHHRAIYVDIRNVY